MNVSTCPNVRSTGAAISTFSSALQLLAASQCLITENWPKDADVPNSATFDFIVCGAGSAGSVVANRLSENKKWKVLLIEAGGDPPEESIIPYLAGSTWNSEISDWGFYTENDTRIRQGFVNERDQWPRGKMLGGSGSSNLMIYLRGTHYDYQQWSEKSGGEEWHPEELQKYFHKAENLQDPKLLADPKVKKAYGRHGPLPINIFNSTIRGVTKKVLSAYEEIGIKNVPDLNAAGLIGSGLFTATVANGQRTSTATAYLIPARDRPNLKIVKNTLVRKLLIDKKTKTVYGVEAERNGKTVKFYSKLEVVLSAGAVNTPKLLMLSGIGPKKTLNSHNIDVVVDAEGVGNNLQDQTIIPLPIFADEPKAVKPLSRAADLVRYIDDRSGTMANLAVADVTAFYSKHKNATVPDYQNLMSIYRVNSTDSLSFITPYKPSVAKTLLEKVSKKALYLFQVVLLRPHSRGYITLKSSDPKDPPLIYPNYFQSKKDLNEVVTALKILSKIVETSYFKSIKGEIARMTHEPCDKHDFESSEYWKCVAINFVTTVFHPVGTAQMGKATNKEAVVDSRLRVHGLCSLRVVDASIMPTMPSCNTNGPVIMVAERASDIIKEDFNNTDYVSKVCKGKEEMIKSDGKSR